VNVTLPENSQRVLRVMLGRPVISGAELAILCNIPPDALAEAVRPLVLNGIISTDSPGSAEIQKSYFNLNPSARSFAEYATG
jgi:hypothetical protein